MNRRKLLNNASKAACLAILPIPISLFRDKIEFKQTNIIYHVSSGSYGKTSVIEDIYVNGTLVGTHHRYCYRDSYLNSLSSDQRANLISGTIQIVKLPKIISASYTVSNNSEETIICLIKKILND